MKRFVTPSQMRIVEKSSNSRGVSYMQLMRNAGCELAQIITSCTDDISGGVIVLAGNGNNGGDGFVAAKLLSELGIKVTVILMNGEPSTEIATEVFCELSDTDVEVLYLNDNIDKIFAILKTTSVIVDAVFGTGFRKELPPQINACFAYIARMPAKLIAVDVPSGGNCENGKVVENTLKCDLTVTFGYEKTGFLFYPLKEHCGEVITVNIGFTDKCFNDVNRPILEIDLEMVKKIIPERSAYSHKGNYGRLVNIAGSEAMPGAAAMSTLAALRCGVGRCVLASVEKVTTSLSSSIYEAMYYPVKPSMKGRISASSTQDIIRACSGSTAVLIGCGLGYDDYTKKLVYQLITDLYSPIILDADGINCVADSIDIIKNAKVSLTITPHAGELARLTDCLPDEINSDRLYYTTKLADDYGITVVSKGVPTIIAGSNGFTYISRTGNSGLAKSGSGDVLAGMISSLTAQGIHPAEAAAVGAYLHGLAADMVAERTSKQGMLPTDVINELPLVFKKIIGG